MTEENTKSKFQELNLSRASLQNTKLYGRRELVCTKEIISYRGAKSFASILLWERLGSTFIAIPYFSIVSYYCAFEQVIMVREIFRYFSGKYFNYKVILGFLHEHYQAKIQFKSLFCNYIKELTIILFFDAFLWEKYHSFMPKQQFT